MGGSSDGAGNAIKRLKAGGDCAKCDQEKRESSGRIRTDVDDTISFWPSHFLRSSRLRGGSD